MLKPLDDVQQTIALIAAVSDSPPAEVRERLIAEAEEIGTTVHASMQAQGIPMYVVSEQLDTFYRESDAFLYETTVWNTCAAKQRMRDFVSSRLQQFGKTNADVFCFGDGLGFDSTWLALQGHAVRYFEPSLRCQEYAQRVFADNAVDVTRLAGLEDIAPQSLDAVVCLDVLEHVPQPQELVKMFRGWLKPDGLLFVHAPFWSIHWTRCTHLKENRHFSGDLKHLYLAQGFAALDAELFWNPLLLQKSDNIPGYKASRSATLRLRLGQFLLTIGRWGSNVHNWIARKIARAPNEWVAALKAGGDD